METKQSWTKWVERPNARQQRVLDQLGELGERRAELTARKAYMTTPGRLELDKIYAELRSLIARGGLAGLGNLQMRDQLGVTSTAYYKIKGHRTGG